MFNGQMLTLSRISTVLYNAIEFTSLAIYLNPFCPMAKHCCWSIELQEPWLTRFTRSDLFDI